MDFRVWSWYFPNMAGSTTCYLPRGRPRLTALGRSLAHRSHHDRVLREWVLGFITAGRLALAVGERRAVLGPGDYYLLPPGVRHCGLEPDQHDVAWVEFTAGGGASDGTGERRGLG